MFLIVAYDIADDGRRLRVATTLKDYGERVQRSVFECLLDERKLQSLIREVTPLIELEEDSIRLYRLCEGCRKVIQVYGQGVVTEDQDVFIV
ncbi:MAG: CRISPR-associated endonuclease Cas2 [Candidatus Methylomirabilales bacterium]